MSVLAPMGTKALHLDGDEQLYEIVDGHRLEIPHMGALASIMASRLVFELQSFAKIHNLGQAVTETLFRLPLPKERNRRPDVAFVSFQRWPKGRREGLDENAWNVVPEVAVEVVSPSDDAEELLNKVGEYIQAGVLLVWLIYPKQSLVHAYESLTNVRGFTRSDTLDGGTVLPGFKLPLGDLFLEVSS
jgi:Uma2 family endonuclease